MTTITRGLEYVLILAAVGELVTGDTTTTLVYIALGLALMANRRLDQQATETAHREPRR